MKSSFSPYLMRLLSYLFLIIIQFHQCDATESPKTFFLYCSGRETTDDASLVNNDESSTHHDHVTVAHPGDRIILDYQAPHLVSIYRSEDCTVDSLSSSSKIADNLFLDENKVAKYTFQVEDVNKIFTFACHDESRVSEAVRCDTISQKLVVQVQPEMPSPSSTKEQKNDDADADDTNNTDTPQPRLPTKFRSRSKPIHNKYQEDFDFGLMFFCLVGIIGFVALIMNCCMEIKDWKVSQEADLLACEMNSENS